jgi:hypothetical protein
LIVQLDLEGNVIAEYSTISEAQEATGAEGTNIRAVIAGRRNTAKGYKWEERYEEEEPIVDVDSDNTSSEWKEDKGQATFTGRVVGEELTTLEDVLKRCKVDLSVWEVKTHTLKHWTTTMKKKTLVDSKSGKAWKDGVPFVGTPVSAHESVSVMNTGWTIIFQHKSDYKERLVEMLKSQIKPQLVTNILPTRGRTKSASYAVEFMITDHHLGKDGLDPNTLKPIWSIDEAMAEYQKVIEFGLSKVDLDTVQEFWLPTGNDLLHVENGNGVTTSGTRVSGDLIWLNLFRYGKEAIDLAIQALSKYAPVKAYFIPGNHDQSGVLSMSEVISALFKNNPNVEVICSGRGREWAVFGNNLIGWHHGNRCDARKAHTMMITDVPSLLHQDQYRALHVGHTHRSAKSETVTLNTLNEEFGLVYEICPSLTPLDAWHNDNIYIGNLRRSKIFCYEYEKGLEAEFIYNLGR